MATAQCHRTKCIDDQIGSTPTTGRPAAVELLLLHCRHRSTRTYGGTSCSDHRPLGDTLFHPVGELAASCSTSYSTVQHVSLSGRGSDKLPTATNESAAHRPAASQTAAAARRRPRATATGNLSEARNEWLAVPGTHTYAAPSSRSRRRGRHATPLPLPG